MAQKTVLVTGAGGYIGRHVVDALLRQGCRVLAADFVQDGINPQAEFISTPIFSGDEDIFDQLGRPDVLIHMAWRKGFVHNAPEHVGDFSSHMTFLDHMISGGLKTLAVMGTMHEVGYWEGAIDENTPCNPLSQYGIVKNAMRQSLLLRTKDTECSLRWLRAYYIIGDDKRGSSIFAKLTAAAENGQETFPFTTGKNLYDFIDVDELADMIAIASLQDDEEGIINVCTGKPESLASRVERFIQEKGFGIKLAYGVFPDRAYDSPGEWGDATRINRIMEKWQKEHA